jgi:hypothetical protein
MKARIVVAESATGHPDGTVSMLRAGITHVWGEKPPLALQAALVVRIEFDIGDEGDHQFDLKSMDADGKEILPKLSGKFGVPKAGPGSFHLILGFNIAFKGFGRYVFVFRVDSVQQDTWTVTASPKPPPGKDKDQ